MRFTKIFQEGLISLASERFNSLIFEDGYPFVPVVSRNWKSTEKRLLIIVESVDRSDLRNGEFLTFARDEKRNNYQSSITNLIPHLLDRAHQIRDDWLSPEQSTENEFSFAAVNFNAKKSRNLPPDQQKTLHIKFAERVIEVIKALKPSHILCCGDTATLNLLEVGNPKEVPHAFIKRGWVIPVAFGSHSCLLTPTLDLDTIVSPPNTSDSLEESDAGDSYAVADLLYFVCRNAANLLAGKHLYSLKKKSANPILIDTIEKFDGMMYNMRQAENLIAVDTETQNLETIHNKLYIIQFCWDGKNGYVVPVDHPHESNPFSEEERKYIKKKLRSFIGEHRDDRLKTLVTINGMFDFRVLRSLLDIKFIYHKVHEVTAGESLLDENMGVFARAKFRVDSVHVSTSYQNLRNMYSLYENTFYYDDSKKVTKENRNTLSNFSLYEPDALLYCATDVTSIWNIAKMQLRRAKRTYVRTSVDSAREVYYPYYVRHLYNLMNATVYAISHMEQDGSPIDVDYLKQLMGKESPILTKMKELEQTIRDFPSVIETEKRIMKAHGRSSTSLFGEKFSSNSFALNKKAHLETLFFDVLKLPVVGFTDAGARAIDKHFVAEYQADHPEVKLFGEHVKASKLMSTYIKGWFKKMMSSVDSSRLALLKPSFGFFTIVTGRLNSFNPSLQQVPSRGILAALIHRMFTAPVGHLNIKYDYSANEVRFASVLSGDKGIAGSFRVGQLLRRKWLVTPTEEVKKQLKEKGDVHVLNVFLFFRQVVDKSHPLRAAVKAIVFGVLYGKSARTLGVDLQKEEMGRFKDEERALTKAWRESKDPDERASIEDKLAAVKTKQRECLDKDWTEYAQSVIDSMFSKSPKLKEFLENSVEQTRKYSHVMSPAGRVRNLWRTLTGKPSVLAAAARRAQNSPTQGFSSEVGCLAAHNTLKSSADYLRKRKSLHLFPIYQRAVHDANYHSARYEFVLPFIHILQYEATEGAAIFYKEVMGVDFTIEPEIEIDIAAHDASAETWDWSMESLAHCIFSQLVEQIKIGRLKRGELAATVSTIIAPYEDLETRRELFEVFPLLNVREDMTDQVELFLKSMRKKTKEYLNAKQ